MPGGLFLLANSPTEAFQISPVDANDPIYELAAVVLSA